MAEVIYWSGSLEVLSGHILFEIVAISVPLQSNGWQLTAGHGVVLQLASSFQCKSRIFCRMQENEKKVAEQASSLSILPL